jgi:hypothetical protein
MVFGGYSNLIERALGENWSRSNSLAGLGAFIESLLSTHPANGPVPKSRREKTVGVVRQLAKISSEALKTRSERLSRCLDPTAKRPECASGPSDLYRWNRLLMSVSLQP